MELTNEFEVAVPVDVAWNVLTDLERIAPCLPGAQLREVEGDEYRGVVKIKVGPITTSYDGAIHVLERDESAHRVTLRAKGRETRGQGNVSVQFCAVMSPSEVGTKVVVTTDLAITGKVAQFGRGVLADVSAKLLDQFVANLESSVLAPVDTDADPERDASESEVTAIPSDDHEVPPNEDGSPGEIRRIDSVPAEPVDLVKFAGSSLARRLMKPAIISVALMAVAIRVARRRRR
ncbi:MAG: SRPBCC family protein [Acidimicrobiales bacterium]